MWQSRGALSVDEHATLEAAVETLARLTEELETITTTLERVRRLIFGPRIETTDRILGKDSTDTPEPGARNPSAGGDASTASAAQNPR